jgi:hypothetical protein
MIFEMSSNANKPPIYDYLEARGLLLEDMMPGIFFGMIKVEQLAGKALMDSTDFEFYYENDHVFLMDRMSYRFNPRK